jgi:HSP20 family protein
MTQTLSKRETQPLRRWFEDSPLGALRREMDEVFENFFGGRTLPTLSTGLVPSVDVSETAETVEVKTDVPGFKPEEINIDVGGNYLTISGEHIEEKKEEGEGRKYHRVERRSGSFSRSVWLPCGVKEDKIEAKLKDGVLMVTLPKAEEAKRRKITVKG